MRDLKEIIIESYTASEPFYSSITQEKSRVVFTCSRSEGMFACTAFEGKELGWHLFVDTVIDGLHYKGSRVVKATHQPIPERKLKIQASKIIAEILKEGGER